VSSRSRERMPSGARNMSDSANGSPPNPPQASMIVNPIFNLLAAAGDLVFGVLPPPSNNPPITREHLRDAMVARLLSDPGFVHALHNVYLDILRVPPPMVGDSPNPMCINPMEINGGGRSPMHPIIDPSHPIGNSATPGQFAGSSSAPRPHYAHASARPGSEPSQSIETQISFDHARSMQGSY
jgi:hypothetical protein